jgi:hypothetical protein
MIDLALVFDVCSFAHEPDTVPPSPIIIGPPRNETDETSKHKIGRQISRDCVMDKECRTRSGFHIIHVAKRPLQNNSKEGSQAAA